MFTFCSYFEQKLRDKKLQGVAIISTNLSLREIGQKIYLVRGNQVMLDTDLAHLYEIETFNLNKAVKRNVDYFPDDFMFQLTREEWISLTFQIGISKASGRGGRRTVPYAFTQEGVAMLSSVLRSDRAREINIAIQRSFVRLRKDLELNARLAEKIDQLETNLNMKMADVSNCLKQVMATVETISKFDAQALTPHLNSPVGHLGAQETQAPTAPPLKRRNNQKLDGIQDAVSQFYQVPIPKLKTEVRTASVLLPRQVCMYLIRKYCRLSYKGIGTLFGGKDHSTVLHACDRIETLLITNDEIREAMYSIQTWLKDKGIVPKDGG